MKKQFKLLTILTFYFGLLSTVFIILFIFINNFALNIITDKFWESTDKNINDYTYLLENGEFKKIPKLELFGSKGYFDVLDENYNTIYSSDEVHTYTKEEVDRLYNIEHENYYAIFNLKNDQTMVIKSSSDDSENIYYVFDVNYNIIDTNDPSNPTVFNQEELNAFHSSLGSDSYRFLKIFKYNNKQHYLIGYEVRYNELYEQYDIASKTTFVILAIVYFLAICTLIFVLNKKINKPLYKLKKAITEYKLHKNKVNTDDQEIIELYEITKQFNNLIADLEKIDSIKKQYEEDRQIMLANISHDLKTPITIIQGYSKAIVDGVVSDDEIINKNKVIYDKTIYLNELVNNFHEYSKLEHPEFAYNFEKTDIAECLRNYLANKYDELEAHSVNLDIDIPENTIYKKIDQNQFKRVLENIINNAIKYNDKPFTLKITLDNKKLIIANNGSSIDDKTAKEIFKPFSMADESRGSGGSGLGLSIVDKIVKDHGFNISLNTTDKDFNVSFIIEF